MSDRDVKPVMWSLEILGKSLIFDVYAESQEQAYALLVQAHPDLANANIVYRKSKGMTGVHLEKVPT
jgi:hypothetical protein